jgi:hypothetical protein
MVVSKVVLTLYESCTWLHVTWVIHILSTCRFYLDWIHTPIYCWVYIHTNMDLKTVLFATRDCQRSHGFDGFLQLLALSKSWSCNSRPIGILLRKSPIAHRRRNVSPRQAYAGIFRHSWVSVIGVPWYHVNDPMVADRLVVGLGQSVMTVEQEKRYRDWKSRYKKNDLSAMVGR